MTPPAPIPRPSDGSTTGSTPGPSSSPSTKPTNPNQPVPSATQPTAPVAPTKVPKPLRIPLGEPANLKNGVVVTITKVESVNGVGRGIGERNGPAVRLTVSVENNKKKAVDLNLALLNVSSARTSAPPAR